tara:strand:+ start:1473 stop:1697 length:225 start_codon:yes stop_codon:yes gene_type:complete
MSILDTIRNIILEDKNIDLERWGNPGHRDKGTDGSDRKAFSMTPPVLESIVSSPRLLALLADALKPYLDDEADD